jgi:acyl-CoA thioesterase FadM
LTPTAIETPPSLGAPLGAFTTRWSVADAELSRLVPHANNVQVLGWIDRLAELHHDSFGASRVRMHSEGRMWFVARHEIDYLSEAFAGDQLAGATWVTSLGRTSLSRATLVWNISTGRSVCRATSRWAHVDLAARRPSRVPDGERAMLAPLTA